MRIKLFNPANTHFHEIQVFIKYIGHTLAGFLFRRVMMSDGGMQSVQLVLEEYFPIGVLHDTETIGDNLCFAFRSAVTNVVKRHLAAPEPGFELWSLFAQAGKNKAAVTALALCPLHL